jgi:hypothetical protein
MKGTAMTLETIELLSLAFVVQMQLCAIVWWASSISSRVASNEKWIEANDNVATRLATIETKIDSFLEVCKDMRETFRLVFERMDRKADKP